MGKNGHNGNGHGDRRFIDAMLDGGPKKDAKFEPSVKQAVFREVASTMSREGLFLTTDWLRHCRNDRELPTVRTKEWKAWKEQAGFEDWFYETLPDFTEMDDHDMQMLELAYWRAVRDGMAGGQGWAVKEFSTRRWPKDSKPTAKGAGSSDLSDWIQSGGATAWLPPGEVKAEA